MTFPILAGNSASTGYNLTRSLRTRASASAYLGRTPATSTNRKVWTYSAWIKRGVLGVRQVFFEAYASGAEYSFFEFTSGDNLRILNTITGPTQAEKITTQVFRDPSAWYHIVIASNSSTSLNLYVNGVQVTSFSTSTGPNATDWAFNQTIAHVIAADRTAGSTTNPFDGYHAELNWVDGQALTPSSFGSTNALTGVWQPAPYTGAYGTNGFYLPFTDNSALTTSSNVGLGKDFSGNGNYWTTNNISITAGVTYDSMTDVPTLTSATAANFAVLNPLDKAASGITLSNGNLLSSNTTTNVGVRASFAVSSGKWYWESVITVSGSAAIMNGIADSTWSTATYVGASSLSWGYYSAGNIFNNGLTTSYGNTYTAGDVIGIALDMNAGTLTFYINNVSQGTAVTGLSGTYFPAISGAASGSIAVNFGQRPFTFSPPSGFVALNTFNLPTSTIVKGSDNMNIALAAGASIKTTTEALFTGQFLEWIKDRANVNNHQLLDGVRGLSAVLQSNTTAAETTYSAPSGNSVGWAWKAGSSSSSNTNGTITSTVSVNASAGFSVVTYTGTGANATVGHGLGVAPKMIIVKQRSSTASWRVYHTSIGNGNTLYLNLTDASTAEATAWNSTSPTSSVFSVGTSAGTNANAATYVAYCWAEIAGFSAFGGYTANGITDGPFIYTGFRPKFIMVKNVNASNTNWTIIDTSRDTYNGMQNVLLAESSAAETVGTTPPYCDALANGFKLRSGNAYMNYSVSPYIYMAFAENPFRNSLAR